MITNKYISMAVLSSLVLASPVFAQTQAKSSLSAELHGNFKGMVKEMIESMRPSVVGTVASVNGTTLTVTSHNKIGLAWGKDSNKDDRKDMPKTTPAPITYTIDASHASVVKAGVASTVSAIAVGDMVVIQGTVTGTNVIATAIRSGAAVKTPKPSPVPLIQGNGQPVIAGSITAINGTTLTVTNKSNVSYTVDASAAKIQNKGALSTLSTIAVGDNVVIQGAVNGTSVTAYSVIDSSKPTDKPAEHRNLFHGLGQFFKSIFGF